MLKSLCGAVLSLMVLAGCGCGAGGSGATEASTIPRTPPEETAPPPAPRKAPPHHYGPILAGEMRTPPGSSGEGAWAAGQSIYLTADDTAIARLSYGEAYNYPSKSCRPVTAAGLLVTLPGARRPQRVALPFERCPNPPRVPA